MDPISSHHRHRPGPGTAPSRVQFLHDFCIRLAAWDRGPRGHDDLPHVREAVEAVVPGEDEACAGLALHLVHQLRIFLQRLRGQLDEPGGLGGPDRVQQELPVAAEVLRGILQLCAVFEYARQPGSAHLGAGGVAERIGPGRPLNQVGPVP